MSYIGPVVGCWAEVVCVQLDHEKGHVVYLKQLNTKDGKETIHKCRLLDTWEAGAPPPHDDDDAPPATGGTDDAQPATDDAATATDAAPPATDDAPPATDDAQPATGSASSGVQRCGWVEV